MTLPVVVLVAVVVMMTILSSPWIAWGWGYEDPWATRTPFLRWLIGR